MIRIRLYAWRSPARASLMPKSIRPHPRAPHLFQAWSADLPLKCSILWGRRPRFVIRAVLLDFAIVPHDIQMQLPFCPMAANNSQLAIKKRRACTDSSSRADVKPMIFAHAQWIRDIYRLGGGPRHLGDVDGDLYPVYCCGAATRSHDGECFAHRDGDRAARAGQSGVERIMAARHGDTPDLLARAIRHRGSGHR